MLFKLILVLVATTALAQFDLVNLENGPVRGVAYNDSRAFFGIPFAAAPINELRFASPQPAAAWGPGLLDALAPKPACPGQKIQGVLGLITGISEDCLHLNVFTPSRARIEQPLPVMLWFYGGAFVLGDGWEGGFYNGTYIVDHQDVIIVTTNYRSGPFGFLVLNNGSEGNYGLEDQRLAMQWVQTNIAAFGGDPTRVTIYGESAGAMSVGCHMSSPLSRGLFSSAIMQSNAFGLQYKPRAAAARMGIALSDNLGCADGNLACLRALPYRDIALRAGRYSSEGRDQLIGDLLAWGPTIDNKNLLEQPLETFEVGGVTDVPLIIGTNTDEIGLFQDIIDLTLDVVGRVIGRNLTVPLYENLYRLTISAIFKTAAPRVLRQYPPLPNNANNYDQFCAMLTEFVFECPSRNAALNFIKVTRSPLYTYRFSHAPDFAPRLGNLLRCFDDAVCHALELPFTWHPYELAFIPVSSLFTPEEEVLSNHMINYWASFASGAINRNSPLEWPQFTAVTQSYLNFDLNLSINRWDTATCDFWDSIGYIY